MAQTRRKRRTKHRGNAAGIVEARGRTGRRPSDVERAQAAKSRGGKVDRRDVPPTWRGAAQRAAIAVVLFVVLIVVIFGQTIPAALGLGAFMMVFYVPLGYYTDLWLYRRRQAKKLTSTRPPKA